jgi:transglutaminase-like putative cysteine protease
MSASGSVARSLAVARTLSFKREAPKLSRAALHLIWVTGGFLLAMLPHLPGMRWWVPLLAIGAAAWRLTTELRQKPLPHRIVRAVIAVASVAAVLFTYRTLNGLEAGTAFLVLMGGMKLLETRTARDLTITLFVSYFLLFAGFLYNQSMLLLPYMLLTSWLLTATLMLIHQGSPLSIREALQKTAKMLLQALPIAVLMFLFFPRLPGQFWALPAREDATSGLSEEMSPGDVSELSMSTDLAFRVKFDATSPPVRDLYWRGPVLHDFDGHTWRRTRFGTEDRPLIARGGFFSYRIVLEPHNRNWVFALDAVTRWPKDTRRTPDYQLVTLNGGISRLTSYALESSTGYRTEGPLPALIERADLKLPSGRNPKTIALAREMRERAGSDAAFVAAVLKKFRNEKFYYTLEPPVLESENTVDEFLFDTRRGFCEHYASAFVVMARAAGIPSRVVTGYQGGEYNPLNDYLIVRQSDAHAWAEVWQDDRGWERVDPTFAIAPERVELGRNGFRGDSTFAPVQFVTDSEAMVNLRHAWDAVNTFWNDNVVAFGADQQRSLLQRLGFDNPALQDFGFVLLASFVGFFVSMSAWLAWQFRPRARDPIVRVYDALCKQLAKSGVVRQPQEGPNDYLQRVIAKRPELKAQIDEIRALYVGLRYGPALLGSQLAAQLSRFKFLVNQLRV